MHAVTVWLSTSWSWFCTHMQSTCCMQVQLPTRSCFSLLAHPNGQNSHGWKLWELMEDIMIGVINGSINSLWKQKRLFGPGIDYGLIRLVDLEFFKNLERPIEGGGSRKWWVHHYYFTSLYVFFLHWSIILPTSHFIGRSRLYFLPRFTCLISL